MKIIVLLVLILGFLHKIDSKNVNQESCSYGTVFSDDVCSECGTSDVTPNIKIVGGQVATPNSWPAQALVIMSYKANIPNVGILPLEYRCGGTLINSRTILTAAHCIAKEFTYYGYTIPITPNIYYPTLESMFTVYLGAHNISSLTSQTNPSYPTVKISVSKVIVHPSFNSSVFLNDIALLTLSFPVTTNYAIKYACLPKEQSSSIPTANQACYASGWGKLKESGSLPGVLYNVKLTVYNPTFCSNVYPGVLKDWNGQICAGDVAGGKDTCQGDSGGGLYIYDPTIYKYVVVGITSYGIGCARPGFPGIYTKVSNYINWIKSNFEVIITSTITNYDNYLTITTTSEITTITSTTSTARTTTKTTSTTTTSTITTSTITTTTKTTTTTTTTSTITSTTTSTTTTTTKTTSTTTTSTTTTSTTTTTTKTTTTTTTTSTITSTTSTARTTTKTTSTTTTSTTTKSTSTSRTTTSTTTTSKTTTTTMSTTTTATTSTTTTSTTTTTTTTTSTARTTTKTTSTTTTTSTITSTTSTARTTTKTTTTTTTRSTTTTTHILASNNTVNNYDIVNKALEILNNFFNELESNFNFFNSSVRN